MTVLEAEVWIAGSARAETIEDPMEFEAGPNLEVGTALAVLVTERGSAVGSATAQAYRRPFLARPRTLDTGSILRVSARAADGFSADAHATSGGRIRVQLVDANETEPGLGFLFDISLDEQDELASWRFTYRIVNETRNAPLLTIDSDVDPTIPTQFVVPALAGDVIVIDWFTEASAAALDDQFLSGGLAFGSSISPIPVPIPEPSMGVLAALGLLALGAASERRRARSGEDASHR